MVMEMVRSSVVKMAEDAEKWVRCLIKKAQNT